LIVLLMESKRWLVTFIPAKLVDSQCLSKSGRDDYLAVYLENRFRLVFHGVQPSLQQLSHLYIGTRIHCGSLIYPGVQLTEYLNPAQLIENFPDVL
jgi:hypothetical protein